jgi:FixJ family two-component response regulator
MLNVVCSAFDVPPPSAFQPFSVSACQHFPAARPINHQPSTFNLQPSPPARVHLLDDDEFILRSLVRWLATEGLHAEPHQTPESLFRSLTTDGPTCLVLDLRLGETDGLSVLHQLRQQGHSLPVIILTAFPDVRVTVRAMRAGAFDFLTKPHDPAELLLSIKKALQQAGPSTVPATEAALRQRAATLTARERQILSLLIRGRLNKQVAHELGIALVTVKVCRARAMRKLGLTNAAQLGRLAPFLELP